MNFILPEEHPAQVVELRRQQRTRIVLASSITASLTAALGLVLFLFPIGGGIARLSFDLPFAIRRNVVPPNVTIVYLDEASHRELNQPKAAPWDRALHAKLIDQLTEHGAKAIVFDILFTDASGRPATDEALADAIKRSGRVILGGIYQDQEVAKGVWARFEELPYEAFRNAAAGWGNVNFPMDPDDGSRRYFPVQHNISGQATVLPMACAVARFAGAPEDVLRLDGNETRWLNYYGPPGTLPGLTYFQALKPNGVPPGFFKDKIVFVGSKVSADFSGKGKDEFLTPYAYWGRGWAPGVEIQATAALNLIQHDWLERLSFGIEFLLVLLTAVLTGLMMVRLRSLTAASAMLAGAVTITIGAHLLVWFGQAWFAWIILEHFHQSCSVAGM